MATMRLKRVTGDDALYLKTLDSTVQLYRREHDKPRREVSWGEAVDLLAEGCSHQLETFIVVGQVVARV